MTTNYVFFSELFKVKNVSILKIEYSKSKKEKHYDNAKLAQSLQCKIGTSVAYSGQKVQNVFPEIHKIFAEIHKIFSVMHKIFL